MSWRDNLREASFRGVPFRFKDVSADGLGRRIKRHERPGGEQPIHEDLGRDTETINITGYVLGPDCLTQALRLRDALLQPGPGTLVHPYYGEVAAVAPPSREAFSTSDGGMVRFDLRFERHGGEDFPRVRIDTAANLSDAAKAIETSAINDFAGTFNVDGAPGWVADSAANDTVTVLGSVNTAASTTSNLVELADLAFNAAEMAANAASLVRDPFTLATRLVDAISVTPGVSPALKLAADTFSLGAIAATTPNRLLESGNRTALVNLVNRIGLATAIDNLPQADFETSADVYTMRDDMTSITDTLQAGAGDDVVRSLSKGLAAVTRHASAIAPALPGLLTISPNGVQPSVVTAYRLYGDDVSKVLTAAETIVRRNTLRHPGFVPAGDPIEVLTNA